MIQSLSYDEIKFDKIVKLRDILNTEDNIDVGYFLEVDSKYPGETKEKTRRPSFCLERQNIFNG